MGEREGGARFGGWEGREVGFLLFSASSWHNVSLRNLILRTVLILNALDGFPALVERSSLYDVPTGLHSPNERK